MTPSFWNLKKVSLMHTEKKNYLLILCFTFSWKHLSTPAKIKLPCVLPLKLGLIYFFCERGWRKTLFWFDVFGCVHLFGVRFNTDLFLKASFWGLFRTNLWEHNFSGTKILTGLNFRANFRFLIYCWVWRFLVMLQLLKILLKGRQFIVYDLLAYTSTSSVLSAS